MTRIVNEGFIVEFDESQEAKDRAWQILRNWFLEEEMFSGESIHQMDVTWEDAPDLLSRIAEEAFQFQVE